MYVLVCTPLIHINLIKNEDEEGKINILQFIKIRNILNSPFTAPLLPLFLVSLVKPWAWNSLFSTYWPTRPAVFFFSFYLFSSTFGFIWLRCTKRCSFHIKCYVVWATVECSAFILYYIENIYTVCSFRLYETYFCVWHRGKEGQKSLVSSRSAALWGRFRWVSLAASLLYI